MINVNDFKKYLSMIDIVINNKDAIPILRYVCFKDGYMMGTDLDIIVYIKIENLNKDVNTCVELSELKKVVNNIISNKYTNIDIMQVDDGVSINGVVLNTLPVDDYPYFVKESKYDLEYIDNDIPAVMKKSLPFTYKNKDRSYIQGVFTDGVNYCATDSYIISKLSNGLGKNKSNGYIIPTKTCKLMANIKNSGSIKLSFNDYRLNVTYDNVQIISKLIDGNYPLIDNVIFDNNLALTLKKDFLKDALRTIKDKKALITLNITDRLSIYQQGGLIADVPIIKQFNVDYVIVIEVNRLLTVLSVVDVDYIDIIFNENNHKSLHIKPITKEELYVVMPHKREL